MSQKVRHGVDDNPNHIPDNRAAGDIGSGCGEYWIRLRGCGIRLRGILDKVASTYLRKDSLRRCIFLDGGFTLSLKMSNFI
jgi:hypothetical protein